MGGGVVGAAAALAIAKNASLTVAIIEAKENSFIWHAELDYDKRVSAISHASQRILQKINAWPSIKAKRMSPYTKMCVWDAVGQGEIFFDAAEVAANNLGYIIEDNVIRASLVEQFYQHTNIDYLNPIRILELNETTEIMTLISENNHIIQTKLLIAADGAESYLRKLKKIPLKTTDYDHTAIVTTVKSSKSHQQTAWQRFLPTGPLAFLPLNDVFYSSIVWSATPDYAQHLMSLDDESFKKTLSEAFNFTLGEVTDVSGRTAFPLQMRHANHYVQNRFALIGDAAHTLHPLAGQGVNLGLLDAAALSEVVLKAFENQRDFSSLATLRKYERWRKADTMAMLTMVGFLKQLFGSQQAAIKRIRNLGLTCANQLPWVKKFMMEYALGKRSNLPFLAN